MQRFRGINATDANSRTTYGASADCVRSGTGPYGPGSGVAPELPLIVESGAEASLTTGAEAKVLSAVNRISLNLSFH
jgi:hypothetical protein